MTPTIKYLIKLFITLIFSFVIIYFYYTGNNAHIENFDWYISYILIIWIIYWMYKYFQIYIWWKTVRISLFAIVWYFLLHLFILSILFFSYNWLWVSKWFVLYFYILLYSIIPIIILFISTWFWNRLLKSFKLYKDDNTVLRDNKIFNFILSLWIWFFSFLSLLTIFWLFWYYNLYIVWAILILFMIFSYKELWNYIKWFFDYSMDIEAHTVKSDRIIYKIAFNLLSTEFLFIVWTLILSVSLINIMRPMPIGWDDLWAYMNIPRQFAYVWDLWFLWWMFNWQVFTGIGFMIGEPNQAFFLNNVWWILSYILIILIVSDLLKTKSSTFINIPMLVATIFISLPMVVFQQAKDMKLDPALFSFTLLILYVAYKIFFTKIYEEKKSIIWLNIFKKFEWKKIVVKSNNKLNIKLIFIIWILSWFVFAIKFTSLLLISAIIGVLFYTLLWWFWFLWYMWLFFAIFTKFGLWSYLNIVYPKDDIGFINTISFIFLLIWGTFTYISIYKYWKNNLKSVLSKLLIYILWIIIALIPWFWKNIYQAYPDINLWKILSWKTESLKVDYTNIYKPEELKIKEESVKDSKLSVSWTTTNEDWGRYFWYEKWLNNYVKLPWNLTMQTNQWGEFTTIWWIFLALLPSLLLFLPYRKKFYSLPIVGLLLAETLLFIIPSTNLYISNLLTSINLPLWYLILFIIFILPVIYLLLNLKNTKINTIFKLNLIFTSFYTFLWAISAYWVVWYGIMMYFWFLLMIAIWLYNISYYKNTFEEKEYMIKFFWTVVMSFVFLVWFTMSVFPHTFNNLKTASYQWYKSWEYTANQMVFMYHPDYLNILYHLNIDKDKRKEFLSSLSNNNLLNSIVNNFVWEINAVDSILKLLERWEFNQIISEKQLAVISKEELAILQRDATIYRKVLYKKVLHPDKKYLNKRNIYRIGTFLKYFIVQNNFRLFEDNLINKFHNYIFDKSKTITVNNLDKLWFDYLLVDLNAATIDRDPRHELTNRYEELLYTFTSDKLNLIETDSLCLKLALDEYSKSKKTEDDLQEYMFIAGVNYETYKLWKVINRNQKLWLCHQKILNILNTNKVDKDNYSYLQNLKYQFDLMKWKFKNQQDLYWFIYKYIQPGRKVLFEIKK